MLITEFTERTGFYPDEALYKVIEAHYMDFNGNKDAFCKAYKKNTDGLAEIIQHEANIASFKAEKPVDASDVDRLTKEKDRLAAQEQTHAIEIDKLTKQLNEAQDNLRETLAALDRELEWKPCNDCGTNMSQEEYSELLGTGRVMSDEEAKKLVSDEFGFSPDRIEIIDTVHAYEVNRHGELRKAAGYKRQPLYNASDYNYVRFDVRCAASTWYYEMINGELKEYYC